MVNGIRLLMVPAHIVLSPQTVHCPLLGTENSVNESATSVSADSKLLPESPNYAAKDRMIALRTFNRFEAVQRNNFRQRKQF